MNQQIIEWAKARKIIPNSTAIAQKCKTYEEFAELFTAAHKRDDEAFKDGIGDVFVTLVIGNELRPDIEYENLDRELILAQDKDLFYILDYTAHKIANDDYQMAIVLLHKAVKKYGNGITWQDCLNTAWNDIKDRTGEMGDDGIFYKDILCTTCNHKFLDKPRGRGCPTCKK